MTVSTSIRKSDPSTAGGRFAPRTAVYHGDRFGAHTHGDARRIHRGIARAHHGDALAHADWGIVERLPVAAHQVDAGEEFVGGKHAVERLAGDIAELRRPGAGAHERRVIAHLAQQLRDGEQLADDGVEPDLDPHLLQVFDFGIDDEVGQAEFGDAVFQHSAGYVQGLENGHRHALAGQFSGAGEAARTAADDGRALGFGHGGNCHLVPPAPPAGIGHEALQAADGHRLELEADHAGSLALRFLRADAPAHRRQRVGGFQDAVGLLDVLAGQRRDEAGDVDGHRVNGHAARLLAAQAAFGLVKGAVQVEPESDFVEIVYARFRRLVRHGGALRRNGLDVLGDSQGGRFGYGFGQLAGRRPAFRRRVAGFGKPGQRGRFVAKPLHGGLLFAREAFLAQLQLIEVDQVAVEIRAVHASELHFPADGDAAGPAHSGAIHHDGIEADDGGDGEGAGDFAARLHHGDGPDGDHFANVLFVGQDVGQGVGDKAVAAVAAIVGGDDQIVGAHAELVFPEDEVLIAEGYDGDRVVPRLLVRPQLRIDGRHAETAAHQHHGALELANMARQAEGANEIEDRVALT